MATPVTVTITNLSVPSGDNFLPAVGFTIPAGYTNLDVHIDLTQWAPTDNIFLFASYSADGGATWSDQGGIGTNGGVHLAKDGITPIRPGFNVGVPSGTGIKVRAHFNVPSSQTTSGTVTIT